MFLMLQIWHSFAQKTPVQIFVYKPENDPQKRGRALRQSRKLYATTILMAMPSQIE